MAEKQYGLIKPQKASTRLLAFASDSDSDDEPSSKKKISIGASESQKRQARILQEDALKEDPTIFQYDEVYDDINSTREAAKKAKTTTESRQPKYISKLLVAAEKRKAEHENRIERQVQKEREAEGDKFKDKEVFVTATYRAKLEERKKQEEAEQREEYLESIGDVRKQNDLSGFYRHVYEQKLGSDKPKAVEESEANTAASKPKEEKSVTSKKRTYRKHSDHENSDSEEEQKGDASKDDDHETKSKKVHLQSNLDADSDFSIDSSSDSESDSPEDKKDTKSLVKTDDVEPRKEKSDVKPSEESKVESSTKSEEEKKPVKDESKKDVKTGEEMLPPPAPPKPKKPKIDMWKKRTVGEVYIAAVQRYYERKQLASA